ncbi:hypothetical protein T01_15941 [Trichinella spiralis]|uniref:Uncharacterized protein n=1 Tax=Trichinella spiralis TaxID=6334 RepID=A0A0V1BJH0_TRISP|nr:hypothetical protein T01_15941 [Trichinella spiralis]
MKNVAFTPTAKTGAAPVIAVFMIAGCVTMVGEYSIPHACCFFFRTMWPLCEADPVQAAAGAFPLASDIKQI